MNLVKLRAEEWTSADDGWPYAGMQNTDIGLASLVNCSVCPVTDGTGQSLKCGRRSPAEPHFRPIWAGSGFRPGRLVMYCKLHGDI